MLELRFERSNGVMVNVGFYETLAECNVAIKEDIKVRSKGRFVPPYFITNFKGKDPEDGLNEKEGIVIDVGSHTEFYHIRRV